MVCEQSLKCVNIWSLKILLKVLLRRIQNCFQPEVGKPVLMGFLVKLSLESRREVVQVTGARLVALGKLMFCFSGLSVGSDMSITVQVGLSGNGNKKYVMKKSSL